MNDAEENVRTAVRRIAEVAPPPIAFNEAIRVGTAEILRRRGRARRGLVLGPLVAALIVAAALVIPTLVNNAPAKRSSGTLAAALSAIQITASPTTDLTSGVPVTIRGTGLLPNQKVVAFQCAQSGSSSGGSLCEPGSSVFSRASSSGVLSLITQVSRTVEAEPAGPSVDCASNANQCTLRVNLITGSGFQVVKDIPLSFASSVASAPPASISVTPGSPYTSGDEVTIMGTHFPPSAPIDVGECPPNIDCGQWLDHITTNASGNFSIKYTLQSVFTTKVPVNGKTMFSCTTGSGCVIQAGVTNFPEGSEIPVSVSP